MRSLDMPVQIIAEFFKAEDLLSLKKSIDAQITKNQEALTHAQYQYEQIYEFRQRFGIGLAHIRSRNQPRMVSLVHTEPFYILSFDCDVDSTHMTDECRLHLFNQLDEQTQKYLFITVGGYDIVYHGHPLLTSTPHAPAKTTFDIQIKNPPTVKTDFIRYTTGFLSATAVHVGPYDTLSETYEEIIRWAKKNGHTLGTDALEDYQITNQMVSDPSLYVTQIYIPLEGERI